MLEAIVKIVGNNNVKTNEPMDIHTTFRAGGRAAYFVKAESSRQLSCLIKLFGKENVPYFILGNGSNVLVKDTGYKGVVIKLAGEFEDIAIKETKNISCILVAGSAALLSRTAKAAADKGYSGMETLSGIPGTIGGAVTMNAGAYGGEIKDIIESADVMDEEGDIITLDRDKLNLSYRHSIVQDRNYIVLNAVLNLSAGDKKEIADKMGEYAKARKEKQPLEYPSAGSTFKRPEGYFAGKLIMEAGFGGYKSGGAMVSEKHCGFVINAGGATATDILNVIEDVKAGVLEKFGVELEPEVKILG